jgi:hypothetical protein
MPISAVVNVVDQFLALYVAPDVLEQGIRVDKIVVIRGDPNRQIARITLHCNDVRCTRFEQLQVNCGDSLRQHRSESPRVRCPTQVEDAHIGKRRERFDEVLQSAVSGSPG